MKPIMNLIAGAGGGGGGGGARGGGGGDRGETAGAGCLPGVVVDRETAPVNSAISGPNREPRSQNVKLIECCQSVRPWSSFLGCGQLSVRSKSARGRVR